MVLTSRAVRAPQPLTVRSKCDYVSTAQDVAQDKAQTAHDFDKSVSSLLNIPRSHWMPFIWPEKLNIIIVPYLSKRIFINIYKYISCGSLGKSLLWTSVFSPDTLESSIKWVTMKIHSDSTREMPGILWRIDPRVLNITFIPSSHPVSGAQKYLGNQNFSDYRKGHTQRSMRHP